MLMLPLVLLILFLIALFLVARAAKINIWTWLVRRKTDSEQKKSIEEFVETTAAKMHEDERAATAIYNYIQRLDTEDAYILAMIAFFWGVITGAQVITIGWLNLVVTLMATAVCFVGIEASSRIEKKIDIYKEVNNRYHQLLKLPSLPKL